MGQRYFHSLTNLSFLKKLKRRLTATADFHHTASKKTTSKDGAATPNASTPQSEMSSPPGTPNDLTNESKAVGGATARVEDDQVFEGEPEMHQKLVK